MAETPEPSIYEKAFAKSDVTDAILVVEEKKLHVNKALLSCHSDYFKTLFNSDFKEKSMEEIPIEDVKLEDFATVLSLVNPIRIEPTNERIAELLKVADRFLLPSAKRQLELFLMTSTHYSHEKIEWADMYNLDELLKHTLNKFPNKNAFFFLPSSFSQLKEKTKATIFDRFLVVQRKEDPRANHRSDRGKRPGFG
ncbi:hypothetical protein CAEBREN_13284 [Caenorhabditis brenneri]|uniref:BTB domain-containing protein n=1 Tax=Caenorhabditis brenneri TaxID=135651 RepID=G0MVV7_CAEBE|nr:hypothetical protein CAEBREN_13284 [Caenorhabditis brenneri]